MLIVGCEYKVKIGREEEKSIIDIIAPGLQTDCQFTDFMIRYARENKDGNMVCRLVDRSDEKIAEIVREGKADFGISSHKVEDSKLVCEQVFVEEVLLITPNLDDYKTMNRPGFIDCLLHDMYIRFDFGEGSDYLWNDSVSKAVGVSLHEVQTG